ncbi:MULTISPECIES: hypothetical protein [unclassified Agrobacterium]|uniref:hypothetical protein n=1 Tax=unclassified Agrobacterium TaxID=2632611 RepID=UPI00244BA6FE|nr:MULTISPECIES: hypothetical protein [unclassified Agrobacterium]MDH0612553.1 hypothetical protein [Agrobacterium sp. GD03872]MDH0696450.1 hypothetical protein [Agrobacterium sp. GD03871]MDH1059352.1 hypothetical protein [Agrobacterium sp. GD03992]MDH2210713.1 hypothetical protein [Agrobacterium sp. GD03643]MDH2218219.1 hypothetical protein [Agrobacterium sp. GD03638]
MAAALASSPASEIFWNKKSYLFSVIYKISSEALKKIAEAIVFLLSNPVKIFPERKTGRHKQYAPPEMQDRFSGKNGTAGADGHAAGDDGDRRFVCSARFCPGRG